MEIYGIVTKCSKQCNTKVFTSDGNEMFHGSQVYALCINTIQTKWKGVEEAEPWRGCFLYPLFKIKNCDFPNTNSIHNT